MSDASLSESIGGLFSSPGWAIAGTIVAACTYAIAKAVLDRTKPEARSAVAQESTIGQMPVPMWALMGPVHDTMEAIRGMAEEQRKQTAILMDIAKTQVALDKGSAYTHRLLEGVLNDQQIQGGGVPHPHPTVPRREPR